MDNAYRRQELVFSIFMVGLVVLGHADPPLDSAPLLWSCLALLSFNLALHWALRRSNWTRGAALLSSGFNCAFSALVVAWSGGSDSAFWPLFLLPIFTACLHLEARHIGAVLAASGAFLGVFSIERLWSGDAVQLAEALAKVGVLSIAALVTGRVSLSERRQRAELDDSRKRLEELARRLDERQALAPERLVHALNNPLTIVLGSVQLALREAPAGSPLRGDLERIERAALRCRELTTALRLETPRAPERAA